MKSAASRKRSAFTLIEVMVALSLLSMIVIGIYSAWYSITKGSKVALGAAAAAQRTRIAMRTVQDSLLCSCMFNQNARYYAMAVENDGDFSSISFVARLPKSFPRSGKFGDITLRRLTFTVQDGPGYKKDLVLSQSSIFTDPDEDEVEHPLVLARDVKMFLIEFPDPRSGEWVPEWANTNQLPRKVRISLALGANRDNSFDNRAIETLVGTVAIPGQAVRLEWQMPPGQLNTPNTGTNINTNQPNSGTTGPGVIPGTNPGGPPGNTKINIR